MPRGCGQADVRLTPAGYARQSAKNAAQADRARGRPCDPTRHSARPGSAWAKWYVEDYNNEGGPSHD